jgi:hypothetical protein
VAGAGGEENPRINAAEKFTAHFDTANLVHYILNRIIIALATSISMSYLAIEFVSLSSLRSYDRKARTHSKKQIRQIASSIERFGFTNPVLVGDDGEIIAPDEHLGLPIHHRLYGVEHNLGLTERKSGKLHVEIEIDETLQFESQQLTVPAGILRQFVADIYQRYLTLKSVHALREALADAGIRSKRRMRPDAPNMGAKHSLAGRFT